MNKMPISWNQIPSEMRQAVVKELDVGTRVNLSMCSKSENQLVRGTKHGNLIRLYYHRNGFVIIFDHKRENKVRQWVLVKPGEDDGSMVFTSSKHPAYLQSGKYVSENAKYSTTTDWRQTILNIMSLIGTKITVKYLELKPDAKFKEMFNWFRRNIQLSPQLVSITVNSFSEHYDESIWDWPSNVKIDLTTISCSPPNLERFNTYDKIVSFSYRGSNEVGENNMTDEELEKLRNAKYVFLDNSDVTIYGLVWWIKQWMTRTNDKESYLFWMRFKRRHEISFESLKNMLSNAVETIDGCSDDPHHLPEQYWKIKIKKNEKAGGIIRFFDDKIEFESCIVDA